MTQFGEGRLVMVDVKIDFEENALAIDTGTSQTLLDLNILYFLGYSLDDSIGTNFYETASGIIEGHVLPIKELSAVGITRRNFEVCTFDFLARGLVSELSGVLGLDFFEGVKICLDFRSSIITVD